MKEIGEFIEKSVVGLILIALVLASVKYNIHKNELENHLENVTENHFRIDSLETEIMQLKAEVFRSDPTLIKQPK